MTNSAKRRPCLEYPFPGQKASTRAKTTFAFTPVTSGRHQTLLSVIVFNRMDTAFAQLYLQVIFSIRHQSPCIHDSCRSGLEKQFCEIICRKGSKPLAVYCHTDHVHLLVQWNPAVSVCELVHTLKAESARFLSKDDEHPVHLEWQPGFTAFSYSRCDVDRVTRHILNQALLHARISFRTELRRMLQGRQVGPDARYLLEWYS